MNVYFSIFAYVIDPPESGNVSLSPCSPEVTEVSITISEIANIGSPLPDVNCSAPGVTVLSDAIVVSCGSHTSGDIIRCNANNSYGSHIFYMLFFWEGKCAAVLLLLCRRLKIGVKFVMIYDFECQMH